VGRLRVLTMALLFVLVSAAMTAGAVADELAWDRQWGLEQIGAHEAWETSRGEGVVVAIVDTGVDLTHPDLAPRLLRDGEGRVVGRDEVDPGTSPQDENGHGTLVAGVAAADHDAGLHGNGIAGVAPRARIMPVRVLDEDGMGSMPNLDAGIRWAVDNGADVINLSLESAVPLPGEVLATGPDDAVNYAWERGVPVVAAAGNSGTPFTDYRPSTPVLLVGASDQRDRRAAFSDAGRSDMVLAPGVDIISSHCRPCGQDAQHGYASASGTSLAAPHAAGTVALLLAAGLDHEQALQRLRETAVEVSGGGIAGSSGHGRIDAAAALGATMRAQRDERGGGSDPGGGDGGAQEQGGSGHEESSSTARSEHPGAADNGSASEPAGEPDRQPDRHPEPQEPADDRDSEADEQEQDAADDAAEPVPEGLDGAAEAPARDALGPEATVDVPVDRVRSGVLAGVATGLVAASLTAVVAAHRRFGLF
jgi:subtilisin family serine protease